MKLHSARSQHPAGNAASIALAPLVRIRKGRLLAALSEDRRPLARPRALGDPRFVKANHLPAPGERRGCDPASFEVLYSSRKEFLPYACLRTRTTFANGQDGADPWWRRRSRDYR
jgi:hypothetical protein